jgi:ribose transport system ATP-binding protein
MAVRGLTKSFACVRAVAGVDLDVREGEIHALLGENGAGKSTVIKILAGVVRPDAGEVRIGGRALPPGFGPEDAEAAGLRFVHQDLGLVDGLSVLENFAFLAGFERRFGLIDRAATAATVRRELAKLGAAAAPETLVGDLPQAERVVVALARVMRAGARVIVLDEVTASLPSPDAARLHEAIRAARAHGVAFIYVSHRLEEVFALCDRLTVLADGRNVASAEVAAVDPDTVVRWIAGRAVASGRAARAGAAGAVALAGTALEGIDVAVRRGEILGITGIRGSGYERLCRWLGGIAAPAAGRIALDGRDLALGDPRAFRAAGCQIVLGDRAQGGFAELTVRENLFPDAIGGARLPQERAASADLLRRFGVRPADASEAPMQGLSGGNQQKVLFARTLARSPRVLVLIDPTAGVDIGARAELHRMLHEAADAGAAIVLGSSDFEEVAAVADRVLVVREGAAAAWLDRAEATWDRLFTEAHRGHGARAA